MITTTQIDHSHVSSSKKAHEGATETDLTAAASGISEAPEVKTIEDSLQ